MAHPYDEIITRKLIYSMEANGWHLVSFFDGEETDKSGDYSWNNLNRTGEFTLCFSKEGCKKQRVYCITENGNEGRDVIADHTCLYPEFNAIIDAVIAQYEE